MSFRTLKDVDVQGKKVLLRSEFNVPVKDGVITDDSRIVKSLPTIKYLLENGAKVVVCAHFGRPKGQVVEDLRLDAVAERLSELLERAVTKMDEVVGDVVTEAAENLQAGEVLLLENVRFEAGETKGDKDLSEKLSKLADMYVSDAFGAVHRNHCSTAGVAEFLPAYAGLLVEKEVTALSSVFDAPKPPVVMMVAGSKMETKVAVIEKFLEFADTVIIGGGIANTFLAAQGKNVGSSLYEESEIERAKSILAKDTEGKIFLPSDVVVAKELAEGVDAQTVADTDVTDDDKILDMGEGAAAQAAELIKNAGTVVWNGPVGVYEVAPFDKGSRTLAQAMAESNADTIIGGGDTADAIFKFGFTEDDFTHVSTGGGASLEFLEGKQLPGVEALKK